MNSKHYQNTSKTRPIRLLLISILSVSLYALGLTWKFWNWDFDDGLIIGRVANNLIQHGEWAYNLGEAHNPCTSALHTILVALIGKLTGDVRVAAHLIGGISLALIGSFTVVLLWREIGVTFALATAIYTVYVIAHASLWGIEVNLFGFLLLFWTYLELQFPGKKLLNGILLGLLVLTRPDAMLLVLVKLIYDFWKNRRVSSRLIAGVLLITVPWIIYSYLNFGTAFPDTLSAKVWQGRSGYWGQGAIYLKAFVKHFFVEDPYRTLSVFLSVVAVVKLWKIKSRLLFIPLYAALQQGAYSILNVPGYHWYFFSADLAAAIFSGLGLGILLRRRISESRSSSWFVAMITGVMALAGALKGAREFVAPPEIRDMRDSAYRAAILDLDRREPTVATLATLEVGTIGFHTQKRILDLVGLTSKNPQFITGEHLDEFFRLAPELVLFHKPLWHFERSVYDDLRFRILYEFKSAFDHPAFGLQYYKKRLNAESLLSQDNIRDFVLSKYQPFTIDNSKSASPSPEAVCILDQVNGQLLSGPEIPIPHNVLRLTGWAGLKNKGTPELRVILTHKKDGVRYSKIASRLPRADVAKHLGDPTFENSGYDVEGSILDLPAGRYSVSLEQGEEKNTCVFPTIIIIAKGAN